MGFFSNTRDHNSAIKDVDLPIGESKRMHLNGFQVRVASDLSISSDANIHAEILDRPYDGPKGIWVISIKAISNGEGKLTVTSSKGDEAVLTVQSFKKNPIGLPPLNSDQGIMARLFLAESISPIKISYKESESKKGMLWMRQVIENRLHHKTPNIFMAKPSSGNRYTVLDIVTAKGQFHGFENYPDIIPQIRGHIQNYVAIANNYNHPQRKKYAEFIENAILAASPNALEGRDLVAKDLYGWRTKDSTHPGGSFLKYKDFAGQTFYILKK